VIGNGVVIDPKILTDELDDLRRRGVDTGRCGSPPTRT